MKLHTAFFILFLVLPCSSHAAKPISAAKDIQKAGPSLTVSVQSNPQQIWRLALLRGALEAVDTCIRIAPQAHRTDVESHAIIFPADYAYRLERYPRSGKWVIKDSLGKKWGALGEDVEITGGEIKDVAAFGLISDEEQQRCPGPYWELSPREAL